MDENMFDLGLDVATISAELPDPVITLSGADSYTVQGTADYPLLALSVYGKSTQGYASKGGTPLGKNLANNTLNFNQNTTSYQVDNGIMTVIGGTKAWSGAAVTLSDNLIIGQTYTVSFNITGMSTSGYLHISNAGKSWQTVWDNYIQQWEKPNDGKLFFTFTAETDTVIISVNISLTTTLSSDVTVNITDIQLELGSTATSYEPYYSNPNPNCPVDIISVGDDGSVEVVACGKNLLQIIPEYSRTYKGVTVTSKLDDNGLWRVEVKGTSTSNYIDFYPFGGDATTKALNLPDGDYILSGIQPNSGIRLVALCRNDQKPQIDIGNGVKLTQGDNDYYYIRLDVQSKGDLDTVIYPMLRPASITDSTYEPYKSTIATITSGLPLCSVGDVRDELIYNADGTGKIIKHTKEVVVDGVNVKGGLMSYNSDYNTTQWNFGKISDLYINPSSEFGTAICSHAVCEPIVDSSFTHIVPFNDNGIKYVRCWFVGIGATTTEELNVWLQSNPVTFVYQLATPQEIELSAAEMAELQKLKSYEGTTSIYNDEQAEMLVKMLRREFDMKYIEWLKESQTWTCPKAGKWKVICVGGGASGGLYDSTENAVKLTPTTAGGTTSFGSIIAANGAPSTSDYGLHSYAAQKAGVSGYGGYTGTSYGGVPMTGAVTVSAEFGAAGGTGNAAVHASGNPGSAVGYGAGGGAASLGEKISVIAGRAGSIESTIVDLEEGQAIMCTVGKGGQTTDATVMGSGADGVIVVQYLGY